MAGLTGFGWAIGCAPLVAELAEAWTVWLVRCTMPVAAGPLAQMAQMAQMARMASGSSGRCSPPQRERYGGAHGGWLAGAAWTVGCDPPPEPWAAAGPCEVLPLTLRGRTSDDPLAPVVAEERRSPGKGARPARTGSAGSGRPGKSGDRPGKSGDRPGKSRDLGRGRRAGEDQGEDQGEHEGCGQAAAGVQARPQGPDPATFASHLVVDGDIPLHNVQA